MSDTPAADDLADDINDLIHLYHEVLNEDTVFDTMFDPAAKRPRAKWALGSDGSGRAHARRARDASSERRAPARARVGPAPRIRRAPGARTGMTRAGRTDDRTHDGLRARPR